MELLKVLALVISGAALFAAGTYRMATAKFKGHVIEGACCVAVGMLFVGLATLARIPG